MRQSTTRGFGLFYYRTTKDDCTLQPSDYRNQIANFRTYCHLPSDSTPSVSGEAISVLSVRCRPTIVKIQIQCQLARYEDWPCLNAADRTAPTAPDVTETSRVSRTAN